MNIKTNLTIVLAILSFAGAIWLITENNALHQREMQMIDKWFDMEDDIVKLEGEVQDMKNQMDRIEMMIDGMTEVANNKKK